MTQSYKDLSSDNAAVPLNSALDSSYDSIDKQAVELLKKNQDNAIKAVDAGRKTLLSESISNSMALGQLIGVTPATLGLTSTVSGLNVTVAPGCLFVSKAISSGDATVIPKRANLLSPKVFPMIRPATAGNVQKVLIQVRFVEAENSTANAYLDPTNDYQTSLMVAGMAEISLVYGTAAPDASAVSPTASADNYPLYVITVPASGAVTVVVAPGAPVQGIPTTGNGIIDAFKTQLLTAGGAGLVGFDKASSYNTGTLGRAVAGKVDATDLSANNGGSLVGYDKTAVFADGTMGKALQTLQTTPFVADLSVMGVFDASASGVVGGAGVDETVNVNAAITRAGNAGGGRVVVRSKNGTDTIYINGIVTVAFSKVVVDFQSPLSMGPAGRVAVTGAVATQAGTPVTVKLTSDAVNDYYVNVVSASGFAAGDLVQVIDDQTEKDFNSESTGTLAINTEILRIAAISGTQVSLEGSIERQYLVAKNARLVKLAAATNSGIMVSSGGWAADQNTTSPIAAFRLSLADSSFIKVNNWNGSTGGRGAVAEIDTCHNSHIFESTMFGAKFRTDGYGVGIRIYRSTLCTAKNNFVTGMRKNYVLSAATSCDVLDNNSTDDYMSGIETDGTLSVNCRINRNRIKRGNSTAASVYGAAIRTGSGRGVLGDIDVEVEDNIIEGYLYPSTSAIEIGCGSLSPNIRNNQFVDCYTGVRLAKNSGTKVSNIDRIVLEHNEFTRVVQPFDIVGDSKTTLSELVLIGNATYEGTDQFSVTNVGKVTAIDNKAFDPMFRAGTYAMSFFGVPDLFVSGTLAKGVARGIRIQNCPNAKVIRNLLSYTVENVPVFDEGGNTGWVDYDNLVLTGEEQQAKIQKILPQRVMGTLSAGATYSSAINVDDNTPGSSVGTSILTSAVPMLKDQILEVNVSVPFVWVNGATTSVTLMVFINGAFQNFVSRRFASGAENGSDLQVQALFTSPVAATHNVDIRIGPSSTAGSVVLNSRFNGKSQPFLIQKIYS